jgi:hypothetical protein
MIAKNLSEDIERQLRELRKELDFLKYRTSPGEKAETSDKEKIYQLEEKFGFAEDQFFHLTHPKNEETFKKHLEQLEAAVSATSLGIAELKEKFH